MVTNRVRVLGSGSAHPHPIPMGAPPWRQQTMFDRETCLILIGLYMYFVLKKTQRKQKSQMELPNIAFSVGLSSK